jgi:1,4-alpha-glucan branching enzyme
MGQEFGQEAEWSHERSLDWHLLENPDHSGIQALVRDLNGAYKEHAALWELDFDGTGFWWLEPNDAESNVVAFGRGSKEGKDLVLCVANLSPVPRGPYRLGLPRPGRWVERLNTDSSYYGGTDTGNLGGIEAEPIPWHQQGFSAEITLPPMGVLWLVPEEKPKP